MQVESIDVQEAESAYRSAVEEWIAAIKDEEALSFKNGSLAQVDRWEQADFREEAARKKVKAAKREYEAALRDKFFGFR